MLKTFRTARNSRLAYCMPWSECSIIPSPIGRRFRPIFRAAFTIEAYIDLHPALVRPYICDIAYRETIWSHTEFIESALNDVRRPTESVLRQSRGPETLRRARSDAGLLHRYRHAMYPGLYVLGFQLLLDYTAAVCLTTSLKFRFDTNG
ncbi:MAG: hypothetical protein EOP04_00035 [Proteobacteria bacterium]|nr:MAG: hypothetical protein EOP04_00035 [Pseudomonadota bacterium]